jgi:hypothetical protein
MPDRRWQRYLSRRAPRDAESQIITRMSMCLREAAIERSPAPKVRWPGPAPAGAQIGEHAAAQGLDVALGLEVVLAEDALSRCRIDV